MSSVADGISFALVEGMLRSTLLAALSVAVLIVTFAPDGWAQARHERVKVTAMKSKGKVIGARIKAVMRPASGYNHVQLVLGKAKKANEYDGMTYRAAAAGQTKGYVVQQGPKTKVTKDVHPLEFVIKFDAKNKLKPGDKVDLTSVWGKDGKAPSMKPGEQNSLHVWGMTRNGQSREIVLPAK